MTIIEAITKVNKLKPNTIDDGIKVEWLSKIDSLIFTDTIKAHRKNATTSILPNLPNEFVPYDENEDCELIVPYTYEDLYLYWLEAQINYWQDDIDAYNKAMTRFNEMFSAFSNWFNRQIMRDN